MVLANVMTMALHVTRVCGGAMPAGAGVGEGGAGHVPSAEPQEKLIIRFRVLCCAEVKFT